MEVILLEKIRRLGILGETVKVAPGYGRNFLVPKGKAIYATKENIKKFELRRAELEKAEADVLHAAQRRQSALEAIGAITLSAKVGEEGKLFGSIGAKDIVDALGLAGAAVEKHEVLLTSGPLRQVGEHEIGVEVHGDIVVPIKVTIIPVE